MLVWRRLEWTNEKSLCNFSGLLLFSLLLMLFNKPEIKLTTTTTNMEVLLLASEIPKLIATTK